MNPSPGFRRHRNPMVVLLPGNIRDRLSRIGVDDHRVRASRNVEPVIMGVQRDVVHAAFAANVKCVFDRPVPCAAAPALSVNKTSAIRKPANTFRECIEFLQ